MERHTFWEIRGGREANFWDDRWQQKEKMSQIQGLQQIQDRIGGDRISVRDYWKVNDPEGSWRVWTDPTEWDRELSQDLQEVYRKEIESRRIRARTGKDILRWGNSMKGSFTTKEAYYSSDTQTRDGENEDWTLIWESNWWPKVSIFIWLATKNKILTWDRIQKKGFNGPSRCYMCKTEVETRNHLLINCPFAKNLWMSTKRIFGKSEIAPSEFNEVVCHWNKEVLQCRVVKRAWNLISGFVLWMIWKERNRRVFRNIAKEPEAIWERAVNLMRETILVERWDREDWKANPVEEGILNKLNLKFEMVQYKKNSQMDMRTQSPDKFSYPRGNFIKLNFDGASKGNPGEAGFGGIFRDSNKQARWIFADWGGEMTNNEAEFWALHQGLRIAVRNGYTNLEIAGDSQIAIETLKKLSNGRDWEKVTNSWRTAGIIQEIADLLKRIEYKIINHVRRKGNQAADFMANWGCKGRGSTVDNQWRAVCWNKEWKDLAEIINADHDQATSGDTRINELEQ